MSYIEFKNVVKEYKMGEVTIKALDNTNFSIDKGELVVIVGPSGAGKTTTLNILGGMDKATSGQIFVNDKEISKLNNKKLIEAEEHVIIPPSDFHDTHIIGKGLLSQIQERAKAGKTSNVYVHGCILPIDEVYELKGNDYTKAAVIIF